MKNYLRFKNKFSYIAIFIILAVYLFQIFNTKIYKSPDRVIASDVVQYYGYLPATFIEGDYTLNFLDKPGIKLEKYWHHLSENGGRIFKMSMGTAMMYAPFFFIANALAEPLGYEANGYTEPYSTAIVFSCVFYVIAGLFFLRKVLLKYNKDLIVAITLLLICLCTNLDWYVAFEPGMSHGFSFALFCVFLFLTEKWYRKTTWGTSILLGLTAGLISLIRPTNTIVVILFILYGVSNKTEIVDRLKLYLKNWKQLLLILISAFIVWIPQMLYWKTITGDWLFYSYGDQEPFFFSSPAIIQTLFSFRKGWLIYTPIMIFALIGIGLLWKYNRRYFYAILIFTVVNIYLMSSWWCWWYGGGLGIRPLIESYAFLAIPLATFLAWMSKLKLKFKIPLAIVVTLFAVKSAFHTVQYYYGAIHWDSMTKEAYFETYWRARPTDKFYELLKKPDYEAAREGRPS